MQRIGILLAGCGAHDGSDIHETVLVATALERLLVRVVFFAPGGPQADVVDHASGTTDEAAAPREALVEAARLARGVVAPWTTLAASDLAAVIVPGGLGTVKTFFEGALDPQRPATLRADVAEPLAALRARGGVVGAIGLAHVLFGALGEAFVADPFAVRAGEAVADPDRRLAWAPGFLSARGLDEAARGIDAFARAVLDLVRREHAG